MRCQYCVVETTYKTDMSSRKSYGIAAVDEEDELTVLETIADICGEYEAVVEFVKLCNDLELNPVHLRDVVDDFLSDF